jgi:hypothetical protein
MENSADLYIVMAYRGGMENAHNYFVGIFNNKLSASECAEKERQHRSGKYECTIQPMTGWEPTSEMFIVLMYKNGNMEKKSYVHDVCHTEGLSMLSAEDEEITNTDYRSIILNATLNQDYSGFNKCFIKEIKPFPDQREFIDAMFKRVR